MFKPSIISIWGWGCLEFSGFLQFNIVFVYTSGTRDLSYDVKSICSLIQQPWHGLGVGGRPAFLLIWNWTLWMMGNLLPHNFYFVFVKSKIHILLSTISERLPQVMVDKLITNHFIWLPMMLALCQTFGMLDAIICQLNFELNCFIA